MVPKVPVESPSSLSHVERYNAPRRSAFQKLRDHFGSTHQREGVLFLAVKAGNDTVGTEGLCPTLLVFGALPRPTKSWPSPTQIERGRAVSKATKEVEKAPTSRNVQFALRYKGPFGNESNDLYLLPHGSDVLIFRDKERKRTENHGQKNLCNCNIKTIYKYFIEVEYMYKKQLPSRTQLYQTTIDFLTCF